MGKWFRSIVLVTMLTTNAWGQSTPADASLPDPPNEAAADPGAIQPRPMKLDTQGEYSPGAFLRNAVGDQKAIWTSPARVRSSDLSWLVPLAGAGAGLLATDSDISRHLSNSRNTLNRSTHISNIGVGALGGAAGGMYLWGKITHNRHEQETGFLAIESLPNALAVSNAVNLAAGRERPGVDNARGRFGVNGRSFPSNHAVAAWSIASVVAHEYPGPLTKLLAYGLAGAVSASRVTAKEHFPSDVLIGSAIGWFVGEHIYRAHHDADVGGGVWNTFQEMREGGGQKAESRASPFVPLDSWVYPAIERLAAMGLIDSAIADMRPWTRLECARLVSEAQDKLLHSGRQSDMASSLVEALQGEFHAEGEAPGGANNGTVRLESLYSRTEYISGKTLNDGFHFAQTQINDFGRPYGEGVNSVTGFSTYATWGPWVGYLRGELQTAPGIPALPLSARQAIASNTMDALPSVPPPIASPSAHRFDLLEAYTGLTLANWDVTIGRQSLEWGPGEGGSLGLSNNAPAINMFRLNRVTPLEIPFISRIFGPMATEFFIGQLTGHQLVLSSSGSDLLVGQFGVPLDPQPIIHGQKVTFKPTRNFEFGFYRTTIYGGPGYPLTFHTLFRSLVENRNAGTVGTPRKPGNRTSELDFSYRLPKLRDWVTFYGEGYTDDQYSPIAYADRSAWRSGLYFSRFPGLARLDLRLEGVYTDVPFGGGAISPGSFYSNTTWRSGYTNDGYLLGNWVGRGGQGAQAWTNYWFTPKDRIQFSFRHQKVSQQFVPGGGTLTDVGVRGDYWLRSNLGFSVSVQYERWLFHVIQPGAEKNVSASIGIQFHPEKLLSSSMFQLAPKRAGGGDTN
jgi:hypothetical protein